MPRFIQTQLIVSFLLVAVTPLLRAAEPKPLKAVNPADVDRFGEIALQPFWKASRLRESLFFIQADSKTRPQASLLFLPKKIVRVQSATRDVDYEEGRDYQVRPDIGTFDVKATFDLPDGSRIPFKTIDDLYPLMTSDVPKIPRQAGDKSRGIFFDNADGYHKLQVEVTYDLEPGGWPGPTPQFEGDQLPHLMGKLRAKEAVKVVLCGDSISEGYNASRFSKAPPGQPAYGELVALGLQKHYGSEVLFANHAVGGWNTSAGLKDVIETRIGEQRPDLVIIAFGMNDVFAKDAAAYQKNTQGMIDSIRAASPEAEFILVATMLGNAEWGMPMEQFSKYRDALKELCGPGIVLSDLTAIWRELLRHKSFYDLTGNGVNHPNDFGHAIYAQAITALLASPRD